MNWTRLGIKNILTKFSSVNAKKNTAKLYWWQTVANQLNQCYLNIKRDCYLLTITHAPKNLDMKSIGINTQDMEKNTNWLIDYRAQSHSLNVFIHFKITIITHWYPQQMIFEKEWFHIMAVGFDTFSSHPECEPNWAEWKEQSLIPSITSKKSNDTKFVAITGS